MNTSTLYALIFLGASGLIIFLEWNRISRIRAPDPKEIIITLIVLFFLGTALAPLFR